MRKTPKKAIHQLAYEHDTVLQAIGGVFFGVADFLFSSIPPKPHQIKQALSKIAVNERSVP